jgi:hypothetical protein
MPGWLADSKDLVIYSWPCLDRGWGKPQRRKSLMSCMQVINHEVERGITRNDFALKHQDQVRPATQFIDGGFRPLKYGAHANCPHEVSRFLQAVCLQNDVRHA